MKKFLTILVVALIAMTCVFASFDANKLSVGVNAGMSNEAVEVLGKGTFIYGHFGHYGFDLAVRGDYQLNDALTLTAIVDWSMPHWMRSYGRIDFFALNTKAVVTKLDIEHQLALMVGATKGFDLGKKFSLDLTAGPEFKISLTDGKIDLGVKGVIKTNYALSDKVDLNVSVVGAYYFLVDGDWFYLDTEEISAYLFGNTVTAGVTYKF